MLRALLPAVLLLAGVALPQRSRDASFGVWPWLVGNVDQYQDELVAKAKSTGLDTIYMHIWRTMGPKQGELRMVDEAGTWNTADGKLIPQITLSRFIGKAHAAGLQVVAVVQVFKSGGPYPSDYQHQDHMIQKVLRYLVHSYDAGGNRKYDLDGIALDYIRWFGGSHTGRDVNRFLDEMRKEVGPMPIHAYLLASPWYIDGPPYNNSFRSYNQVQSLVTGNFGQNWEDFARRIDCLMPMAYVANGGVYGNNLSWMEGYLKTAASYARQAVQRVGSKARVVPAIRTWTDSAATATRATIEASARGSMAGGADGFMAFRYFTARGHEDWFQALARYCEPGPDLPIASLWATTSGLEATLNTGSSAHAKYSASQLRVRFDLNGDGKFDTAELPLGQRKLILPGAGVRRLAARVSDPRGATATAGIQRSVPAFFLPEHTTLSAAKGGQTAMRLAPGLPLAGSYYVVFTTMSGTSPGIDFGGGVVLPINIDFFGYFASGLINQGPFQNFFGTLNLFGHAGPSLVVPGGILGANMVGTRMHFAALDLAPVTLAHRYASNAVEVRITP